MTVQQISLSDSHSSFLKKLLEHTAWYHFITTIHSETYPTMASSSHPCIKIVLGKINHNLKFAKSNAC